MIPQNLRDYANIKDSSVIVGLSNRAEIWSQENWEKYNSEEGLTYEELAEKMSELGI